MKYPLIALATLSMSLLIGCSDNSAPTASDDKKPVATEATGQPAETAAKQTNNAVTYRIGTMDTYPPFATADANGLPDGFDIEIIEAIAKEQGFNVEFFAHPWDQWKTDLTKDKVDVWVAGIAIKDDRKEFATFSDPYMADPTTILIRDDEASKGITQENLKDYKVGAEKGSPAVAIAESLTGSVENIKAFDTNYHALEALLQKKIDAIVGNENALTYLSKSFPEYKFKAKTIESEANKNKQLGFMVQKDKPEVVAQLNEGLKVIKANGEFDKIKEKWFGKASN